MVLAVCLVCGSISSVEKGPRWVMEMGSGDSTFTVAPTPPSSTPTGFQPEMGLRGPLLEDQKMVGLKKILKDEGIWSIISGPGGGWGDCMADNEVVHRSGGSQTCI